MIYICFKIKSEPLFYFKEDNNEMFSIKMTTLGLVSFKESIISNLNSLKEGVLKKDTSEEW